MSDDANRELDNYFQSPISMIDASGSLMFGLSQGTMSGFGLFFLTYHPLPENDISKK